MTFMDNVVVLLPAIVDIITFQFDSPKSFSSEFHACDLFVVSHSFLF
jgi:hypothetical protein